MKFKKIVTVMLLCALISGQAAFAAAPKAEIGTTSDGAFTISVSAVLKTEDMGKKVNILVLNPSMTVEDIGVKDGALQMQYTQEIKSENFTFEFPLHLDTVNDSGYYTVILKTPDGEISEQQVYFATEEDRRSVIKALNLKAGEEENFDEFKSILLNNSKTLSFEGEILEKIDKEKLATLAFNEIKKNKLNEQEVAKATTLIKELIITEAFNESLADLYQGTEYQHSAWLDFADTDNVKGDIYKTVYSQLLSTVGKEKVKTAMLSAKSFKNAQELKTTFAKAVVMYAMNNSATDGNGHVSRILTKDNAAVVGIDISNYLNITSNTTKSKVDTYLINQTYTIVDEIPGKIALGIAEADKSSQQGGSGSGSSSGGGSSSPSNGFSWTGTVTNNQNNTSQGSTNAGFKDLSSAEWAKEAILALHEKKIINGVTSNTYEPQSSITREQFAAIVLRAIGAELTDKSAGFLDVKDGSWYAQYVNTAYELNITNGKDDGSFGVGEEITRQDLAVMLVRAMPNKLEAAVDAGDKFKDDSQISDYAREAVYKLVSIGAINGFEDGSFKPKEKCTRAQAAKVIYEMIKED